MENIQMLSNNLVHVLPLYRAHRTNCVHLVRAQRRKSILLYAYVADMVNN